MSGNFEVVGLAIDAVRLIRPRRIPDSRGYFVETWNQRGFAEAGIDVDFVQDNCSCSRAPGTMRGLHYQRSPRGAGEARARGARRNIRRRRRPAARVAELRPRMSRCAVRPRRASSSSFRSDSPTVSARLSRIRRSPTRSASSIRRSTTPASLWDDPDLGIEWPLRGRTPIMSDKDQKLPRLAEIEAPF